MRYALRAGVAIVMIATYPVPHVWAQAEPSGTSQQFSNNTGEQALKAQNLISNGRFRDAIQTLNQALSEPELTRFEKASLHRMRASVFVELEEWSAAIRHFELCIAADGLPVAEQNQVNVVLAQLLIANGEFRRGANILEAHHRAGGSLNPAQIGLLTKAWIELKAYDRALPWAKRWFDQATPPERKHFDLLNFIYNKTGNTSGQADIIEKMIVRWPDDKALWQAWAGLLANGGDEQGAFEVNILMHQKGLLTEESELLRLVQYYGYYGIPYWAARLLEDEMASGRIKETQETLVQLSNLWRQAREYDRAIPVLEKAAGQSRDNKLHAALGEALYNRGACGRAETAFSKAIDLGYPPGKAWMLIATCRYEQSQIEDRPVCEETTADLRANSPKYLAQDAALAAFENVAAGSPHRSDAQKWTIFVRAERKAIEDRCAFQEQQQEMVCFLEIERAYDSYAITRVFEVGDACKPIVPAYDSQYRKGQPIIQN